MPTQRPIPWRLLFVPALASLVLGCADESIDNRNDAVLSTAAESASARYKAPIASGALGAAPETPSAPEEGQPPAKSALTGRKIIYHGQVDLVTKDLDAFEMKLTALVETQRGYIADSSITGMSGTTRRGSWKVRIPAEGYEPFVKAAASLGELVLLKTDSQDVSEEFYDIEARQAAKKVEETRLLKHLEESTGKLEDILMAERELSRVRGEIEQMQGRLRMLSNLSSLATVDISASEIENYVPPQAPTLGTRVARTFSGSVELLRQVGETLLMIVVALVPWLPFLLFACLLMYWSIRRASRRRPTPTVRP